MLGCCLGDVDKGTPNPCYRLLSQITQRTHTNAEFVAAYGAGDGGEDGCLWGLQSVGNNGADMLQICCNA